MNPEPTLKNILDQTSLKWVFVGGKGGVGKTTTSSSLAIQLAAVRSSVLLISTDPAHNLSDAFNQQFSKVPSLVNGFNNLYAMEVDPHFDIPEEVVPEGEAGAPFGEIKNLIRDVGGSLPGMDEAMGMLEVMNLVNSSQFSVVVFDTPPTGHMLRFLSLPAVFEKTYGRLAGLRGTLGPMISQISNMFGMPGGADMGQMNAVQERMANIKAEFSNPQRTTFVGVCIAEFLSLYETERLVQELAKLNIDVRNIVVNQLVIPEAQSTCEYCRARQRMQRKYLDQMAELYEDFHLTMLPMRTKEVRGVPDLTEFSRMLLAPPANVRELQRILAEARQ